VLVLLERGKPEDCHEALAGLEVLEAGDQPPRAPAPEVVDPVVAVWRGAELAEPAKDGLGRRVGVDGPVHPERVREQAVARQVRRALLLGRAPPAGRLAQAAHPLA
jgi:hypothetical protein